MVAHSLVLEVTRCAVRAAGDAIGVVCRLLRGWQTMQDLDHARQVEWVMGQDGWCHSLGSFVMGGSGYSLSFLAGR